ncbi:hypothetical protein ACROYT_G017681 [Oculina patagonica]
MASSLEPLVHVVQASDRTLSSRELREKYNSYINADPALVESRRWIEEVTRREFKSDDFRESLADGILLCELIEIVGDISLGRINRLPTAYAGIDNLNLYFKACERLGLKRLQIFDTTDLQEVTSRRGDSTSSRAKETQRRLQNVAITILWLAKAARKQGYQGPPLDVSCFDHLLPEAHLHGKKERGSRKRHSLGDLETKSSGTENIPPKKRDRVFDKIDIKDRKEKFRSLEKEAKQESAALDSNRRRSTGGILKRKEKTWPGEEKIHNHKDNKQHKSKMPDPKFHEKKELFNRRDQTDSASDKSRRRGSGSTDRVTSPPPISLGKKVEVDLKEKQKKFEGLDKNAEKQSAVLRGKARPVSWGPGEIRQALKKQGPVDIAFKEKHQNYEQLQRQATTESAVLQGKIRPQPERDEKPQKVPITGRSDVKLREKQKDFEQRDYQAQREKAVLEGNLRLSATDGKGKRPDPVMVPKREQVKLDEKKATFEHLDRQAEQDASILRGQHRPPLTDMDGRKRSSKVGLPRDASVGLLEKQRTFEDKDYQARKESEILQKNKRKSFGSPVKEPMPLSTSTRPHVGRFQSPSDRQWDTSDVRRRSQQERPSRPVSNYYEYSSLNDVPKRASGEDIVQVSAEEPMESAPSLEDERVSYRDNRKDLPAKQNHDDRAAEDKRREYSDYVRRRYEESRRRRSSGEEPLDINLSDAKNLPYRDLVRAPPKKSRDTFIREKHNAVPEEEMPWRKEVREVKDKRHFLSDEERNTSYAARPSSPRSELGKAQYLELVVPPSKRALDSFARDNERVGEKAEEMPWRKEVKEIRRSPTTEEAPAFLSFEQPSQAEVTRIRPPSLKTRDAFVTSKEDKDEEEMPWRREVRELKERPRTEDEYEHEDENPLPEVEPSTRPNLRKLSYKEFINVPSRKRRDVFQPGVEKDEEEMPWRKEVREIKRSSTDEEEEQLQKSSVTLAHSVPDQGYTRPAYNDLVVKPSRKARDHFVTSQDKEKEEMPWRKEVREIKRTVTEDEPVQRSSAANVHSLPEDARDYRKFSYQDFVARPRKKSVERFLANEKEEKEEMPWRKEVRELKYRPPEEEQINQSSRSELESAPDDSFHRSFERPSKWSTENGREANRYDDTREANRNGPYPARPTGVQNLSYKDFICPPSKTSEQQGQAQRKTKVKDITKKFATLEAQKDRPRENGPPARKSLVDVAELKRIERDMRTKSWHGFPDDNDSDEDYDAARRRLIRSEDEDEEERLRQQHHRDKISGMEELDDVFQDPEGYFDQIQGPPPEKFKQGVVEEAPVQYEAPTLKERDDKRVQVVTVRSTNENDLYRPHDQHGQPSLYTTYADNYQEKRPVREEFHPKRRPSDDRVVVKQNWIQPNRVELAEASPNVQEQEQKRNTNEEFIPRDNGPFVPQYYRDERPQVGDYPKSYTPVEPNRDHRRDEHTSYLKGIDPNEEQCYIEQSEYSQENQPYHPGRYGFREPNQAQKEYDDWKPRDMRHDPREHLRNEPTKKSVKDDRAMVFGAPIMVTAKPRTQQSTKQEGLKDRVQEQPGSYDFMPAEERSFNSRNAVKSMQGYRDISQTEERSYYDRNGTKSMQDDREKIENARGLVLQDIRSLGKKDIIEPLEEPRVPPRPQVFGVFARTGAKEMPKHEQIENSFQETRYGDTRKLDDNYQDDLQNWTGNKEREESDAMYMEARLEEHDDKGYDYENSVANHTELHPMVLSTVESQTRQWGDGVFDPSPQKDKQRTGRGRVMHFSDDLEDQMPDGDKTLSANVIGSDNVFQTSSEPVQIEVDRRREQKEKEEIVKEQLRDAEYREKYRREFEEKNRKQQEKTKYLMSLQMRASLDDDEDYGKEDEKPRDTDTKEGNEIPPARGRLSDEDLVKAVAAEEDYWNKKMKRTEGENREASRHERPRRINSDDSQTRISGIDFVSEENVVRREKKAFDQEERLRKLKAEEEFMAQEAERLMRERAALKQRTQAEEPIIAPVEKPPVEFSINEEIFNDFLVEDKSDQDFYDENRNHNAPNTKISGQRDGYYYDEEYKHLRELELREKERQYSDSFSKPQADVLPMNGYHHESEVYPKAPAEILENGNHFHQDEFPGNSEAAPEVNGFEGYSIYETFIHGESNHVICTSCGTSIEKSPSMYIAELDRYWHVNCFSCVVCRAWFGDEFSPVLHITNNMLHCERCYITDEGERCTEV